MAGVIRFVALLAISVFLTMATQSRAVAAEPIVRALFFYLPTCEHCHKVITEDLPPLMERYGDQLLIAFVDVSGGDAIDLYYSAMDTFLVPEDLQGVPIMIVGDQVLNGDVEIPERLPGLVEEGLAAGGVEWPAIPGIETVAAQADAAATEQADSAATEQADAAAIEEAGGATVPSGAGSSGAEAAATDASGGESADARDPAPTSAPEPASDERLPDLTPPTLRQRWAEDPIAFGITAVVLAVMAGSIARVGSDWWRGGLVEATPKGWQAAVIPILCIAGIGVAAYLSYIETTSSKAMCGPVGDCNAVQQSSYARLLGVLPVGVLGLMGYVTILAMWIWQRYGPAERTCRLRWVLPVLALVGITFSVYLTLLELFVIGAVCMWCVTSALIMTGILWAVRLGWAEPSAPC